MEIEIQFTQKVTYKQRIEVTPEEYETMKLFNDDELEPKTNLICYRIIQSRIDFSNVYSDGYGYHDVTVKKIKE